ncbi:MAG TPA: hypothetical protein VKB19_17535 [Pedobacter sp.]|nr:hypothetical protein [Pedobacter sp.]
MKIHRITEPEIKIASIRDLLRPLGHKTFSFNGVMARLGNNNFISDLAY